MDILIGILTVVEVLVCLLMILIVLMQRPRQEGLGASFGDGAMTQLVGAQTTNVLQKGTVYLAVLLFVLTISLAMLTTKRQAGNVGKKVFSEPPAPVAPATPPPAPAVEVKPVDATKSAVVPAMKEPVEVKTTPAPAPTSKAVEAPKSAAPAVEAVKAPAPVVPPAPAAPKP